MTLDTLIGFNHCIDRTGYTGLPQSKDGDFVYLLMEDRLFWILYASLASLLPTLDL